MKKNAQFIVGAALGNCVHVAGVANFLRMADQVGFRTKLLGAAVGVDKILEYARRERPEYLAVSYRLTPENADPLLRELVSGMREFPNTKLLFGGTPKVIEVAQKIGGFQKYFEGDEPRGVVEGFLLTELGERTAVLSSQRALDRLSQLIVPDFKPDWYNPIIRHHFGLPTLERTVAGIEKIADAGVIDVVSIATDQNAQEFFFRPKEMDCRLDGAGGVPVRKPQDLHALWKASQRGSFPRLRTYSGTRDLIDWANMSIREINQAWGTVPLTWYSELDGRSRRPIAEAIAENKKVMAFYGAKNIPVEVNEAHHWSLRESPDTVAVAMAYIAGYNAKSAGVKHFFAQYMFNNPPFTSQLNDLAKMWAKSSLIETLRDRSFTPYRQVRAGLSHFAGDMDVAKGQLAQATSTMLALRPHILHVVAYSEASHAAEPKDVIASAKIVHGVLRNARLGSANLLADPKILQRRDTLIEEARILIGAIETLGRAMDSEDPLADPAVIARAINIGLVDGPHLAGQVCARGAVVTMAVDGASVAMDPDTGAVLSEEQRIAQVFQSAGMTVPAHMEPVTLTVDASEPGDIDIVARG